MRNSLAFCVMALLGACTTVHQPASVAGMRAVRRAPLPDPDPYESGKLLLAADRPADALGAFRKALARAPQSREALNGMAAAYDALGRPDMARGLYEAALAAAPGDPVTLHNLGLSRLSAGDLAGAEPALRAAAATGTTAVRQSAISLLARLAEAQAEQPAPVLAAAEPERPVLARLERVSAGEIRLIIAPGAPGGRAPSVDSAHVRLATAFQPTRR
jgi:Flp pilus assembly protein TadD